ncbi:MAG: hypothetical protein PHG61_02060 [Candidatus Marinimicrobia bacterium]|jgi:hypothetical protein|nr:hypothetical protein [Candidatus Neomarinimicrobiota bacterium]
MPKTKEQTKEKPKAARYPINQLVITGAFAKTFSTGSQGFFGQALDPASGKKYQIIGAVEIRSKN